MADDCVLVASDAGKPACYLRRFVEGLELRETVCRDPGSDASYVVQANKEIVQLLEQDVV